MQPKPKPDEKIRPETATGAGESSQEPPPLVEELPSIKLDMIPATDSDLRRRGYDRNDVRLLTAEENPEENDTSGSPHEGNDEGDRFSQILSRASMLFPKVEPLPWATFFELALVCAIPAIIYIIFFTKMGFGLVAFYFISKHYEEYAPVVAGGLAFMFLFLYLLDVSYWGKNKVGKICRILSFSVFFAGVIVLVLLITRDYPYGPICLFAVLIPIWLTFVKIFSFGNHETKVYITWLSSPLFVVSFLIGLSWLMWSFLSEGNEWNLLNSVKDAEAVGCEPDFDEYPDCKGEDGGVCFKIVDDIFIYEDLCDESCAKIYSGCLNTFIVWVGPLLITVLLFFLSFFCTFLRSESEGTDIVNFAKLWLFLLFAMWCSASLIGAGDGVTSALAAFTLTSFVGSFVFLAASYTHEEQKDTLSEVWKNLNDKYGNHLDTVKGLLIVTCAPVALVYIMMSFLNQCVRRLGCFPLSKELRSEDDKNSWITKRTMKQMRDFKTWDHTKVFTYAIYWGIAFMTLQVIVSQFTLLFLSWLIEQTSSLNVGAVTGIMVAVGLFMFLLPPVPGVPIYLTLGIVIVATGREMFGIVGSVLYCVVVSLIMKLIACALQQKLIGENLSTFVSVRQLVQINSQLIRSMKLILSQKGLSVPKVSILIGGPDWPTSVLAGIMRLGLVQILIGTTPVIFLIIPTVMTGSFTYMASLKKDGELEFYWAGTVATIFATVTVFVQFGSMIVAAYYLEKVATEQADELELMPYDEEVKKADEEDEQKNQAYAEVTQWHLLPCWARFTLLFSLILMIACCYMVQLFQSNCFADYELTYTIDEHLGGDWKNLVLPMGRLAIWFFICSSVFLTIFMKWATLIANRRRASIGQA